MIEQIRKIVFFPFSIIIFFFLSSMAFFPVGCSNQKVNEPPPTVSVNSGNQVQSHDQVQSPPKESPKEIKTEANDDAFWIISD
jgi:hypothetical protein